MGCQGGSPSHPKLGGYFMMLSMGVNSSRGRLHTETRARCELGSRGGRAELSREKRTGGGDEGFGRAFWCKRVGPVSLRSCGYGGRSWEIARDQAGDAGLGRVVIWGGSSLGAT